MPTMQSVLETIQAGKTPLRNYCFSGLSKQDLNVLEKAAIKAYEGKVRQCLSKDDTMLVVHTDRLTAFDRYIGEVPFKGAILSAISDFWLQEASKHLPNHFIESIDSRTLAVKKAEPVKAEVIVRGYLAGSMLRAYQDGDRIFCGVRLPNDLRPYEKLPELLITPTKKAEAFEHDENTTKKELIESGVVNQKEWNSICDFAKQLFSLGQEIYQQCGWILVDTKYEFGRDESGNILIIDEIHTPDSSRLWVETSYKERLEQGLAPEMLDKEIIRSFLLKQGFSGLGEVPKVPAQKLVDLAKVYLSVAETLTGGPLQVAEKTTDVQKILDFFSEN